MPAGDDDSATHDEESQTPAADGYPVLRVNYRGSGDDWRKFLHAGGKQRGRAMQDDLSDATRWAIVQKIARTRRTGYRLQRIQSKGT